MVAFKIPSCSKLKADFDFYFNNCITVSPLAQSAERGAVNAKAASSTLTRTTTIFLLLFCLLLLLF